MPPELWIEKLRKDDEGGSEMTQNNKQTGSNEKPAIKLKPLKELKGFEIEETDALICDMETGICGPVDKKKEKNK